jgi:hypothetical protein
MRLALLLAASIGSLAAVGLPAAAAQTTGIVSLAELRNQSRPLLIFAPKPNDPQLEIQLRRLQADAATLAERGVVVIALPYQSPSTTSAQLTDSEATAARRRFSIAPGDFAVILLGKDGSEKLRSLTPLTLDKLRNAIDTMPMRQNEMRQK